jgi:hypothetical protein
MPIKQNTMLTTNSLDPSRLPEVIKTYLCTICNIHFFNGTKFKIHLSNHTLQKQHSSSESSNCENKKLIGYQHPKVFSSFAELINLTKLINRKNDHEDIVKQGKLSVQSALKQPITSQEMIHDNLAKTQHQSTALVNPKSSQSVPLQSNCTSNLQDQQQQNNLVSHLNINKAHVFDNSIKCLRCSTELRYFSTMRLHMYKHWLEDKICGMCNKPVIGTSEDLNLHLQKHLVEIQSTKDSLASKQTDISSENTTRQNCTTLDQVRAKMPHDSQLVLSPNQTSNLPRNPSKTFQTTPNINPNTPRSIISRKPESLSQNDNSAPTTAEVRNSHGIQSKIPIRNVSANKPIQKQNEFKAVQCPQCPQVMDSLQNYKDHLTKHWMKDRKCGMCLKDEFNNRLALERHVHSHLPTEKFICQQCKMPFNNEPDLNRHCLIHNPTPIIKKIHAITVENHSKQLSAELETSSAIPTLKKETQWAKLKNKIQLESTFYMKQSSQTSSKSKSKLPAVLKGQEQSCFKQVLPVCSRLDIPVNSKAALQVGLQLSKKIHPKSFNCKKCERTFDILNSYHDHLQQHWWLDQKCAHCGLFLSSKFKEHVSSHT